jgi:His-Xaa-Ser system protein HxsD
MTNVASAVKGLEVSAASNSVALTVSSEIYGREAVLGAAYAFIDRCYVLVDAPAAEVYVVTLTGRTALDATSLSTLGGEFGNELLAQQLRHLVSTRNRALLESVVGGAVAGAVGSGDGGAEFDLSALENMEFEDEPFEDPLGIAMSWEEKYGNKRASKKEAAEMKDAAAGGEGEAT